jgi:hypothetical protein
VCSLFGSFSPESGRKAEHANTKAADKDKGTDFAGVETMRGMKAPLSRHEETTLLKVGFGSEDSLEPRHLQHLLHLDLIEWKETRWLLTVSGRLRHNTLAHPASEQRIGRHLEHDGKTPALPPLSSLLAWVCSVEGVTLGEIQSLEDSEGSVVARLIWSTGRSRISIYPLVVVENPAASAIAGVSSRQDREAEL